MWGSVAVSVSVSVCVCVIPSQIVPLNIAPAGLYQMRFAIGMLYGGQELVLLPHIETTLLPWTLQLQRLEVIAQATFSGSDDGDQAEIVQHVGTVDGSLAALQHGGHVQLLHHQIDDLTCRRLGRHMQLETRAAGQTRVVGRVHLYDAGTRGALLRIQTGTAGRILLTALMRQTHHGGCLRGAGNRFITARWLQFRLQCGE